MGKLKKGKCQKLWKCCREIRICAGSIILYHQYIAYNSLTDEVGIWKCIKLAKDHNDHIMQRIYEV